MTHSLHALVQSVATAHTERELRFRFIDGAGELFGVQRWGIYLLDEQSQLAEVDICGVPNVEAFVERYEQVGRSVDPVMRYVIERHAPAHEAMVLPPGGWKQCELYQRCCASYDHEHIMTGPIVGGGRLVGSVHFARVGEAPAFTAQDLGNLSALCAHLSACLAGLRIGSIQPSFQRANPLTPREQQIAELVAQGLTNVQIGGQLWITPNSVKQALKRMYRKLQVSSRAEMVAHLYRELRLTPRDLKQLK